MIRIALFIIFCIASGASSAICKVVPVEEQFRSSDNVFIATITSATVSKGIDFTSLKSGSRYKIDYSFVVAESFKGKPSVVRSIHSYAVFDDPKDNVEEEMAESMRLVPGDSVILFTGNEADVAIGYCTAFSLESSSRVKKLRRLSRVP
jgi:hypothetical protein